MKYFSLPETKTLDSILLCEHFLLYNWIFDRISQIFPMTYKLLLLKIEILTMFRPTDMFASL